MTTTKKLPTHLELASAYRRATEIIDWMMPYIGSMCPPSGGIAELNDHCIFAERNGFLPMRPIKERKEQKGRPLNQTWDVGKS